MSKCKKNNFLVLSLNASLGVLSYFLDILTSMFLSPAHLQPGHDLTDPCISISMILNFKVQELQGVWRRLLIGRVFQSCSEVMMSQEKNIVYFEMTECSEDSCNRLWFKWEQGPTDQKIYLCYFQLTVNTSQYPNRCFPLSCFVLLSTSLISLSQLPDVLHLYVVLNEANCVSDLWRDFVWLN